ncbi:hypothetical protein NQZ68_004246 [Dissostichus eleginoides]|uniref:FERM ARHGEF and pleckstrin domain containing protein 1 n=1 Tax=Dissostichus eleginoides TaxID=100907 RepID=A0AAD9CKA3_DISEL|nr:hypothetical protein NQZ68_004246 [Dissostichus eleginoides]KAK1903373.1 FERM ARHGEF and pleckstrin domain containing protein 1 [Dissostichus eleginoides]
MAEPDPEPMSSGTGHRLGAPETLGISTLDPGHRSPAMPPGRLVSVRVRMLDDTEELFDISVFSDLESMAETLGGGSEKTVICLRIEEQAPFWDHSPSCLEEKNEMSR